MDGAWELSNPVDPVTGLWYEPTTKTTAQQQAVGDDSSASLNSNERNNRGDDGADWAELIPMLLRHGYRTGLNIRSSSSSLGGNKNEEDDTTMTTTTTETWDYPLLLSEKSYNPPPLRQQLLEVLMEELQVPSVFVAKDAVLQCYACGRTQGTVVDMGYGGTTVTPVYEGYVEIQGIQRAPIGLSHMDDRILQQLDDLYSQQSQLQQLQQHQQPTPPHGRGGGWEFLPLYQVKQKRDFGWLSSSSSKMLQYRSPAFHHASRLYVAQECRLLGAGIAVNTTITPSSGTTTTNTSGSSASFQAPNKSFSLPDGTEIQLSSNFCFQSANILLGRPQIVVIPPTSSSNAATTTNDGGGTSAVVPTTMSVPLSSEQEARQQLYQSNKQEWKNYIIQQQQQLHEKSDSSDAPNYNSMGDSMNELDAAAVGIAKRKTKRQKTNTNNKNPTNRSSSGGRQPFLFSNSQLNATCAKYFQTMVDQALTSAPIAQMICESVYKCDRDQQPALLGNIIVGGGGSCLGPTEQAVPDLLKEQTESLIHIHTPGWRIKLLAPAVTERAVLTWLGGSILGSLGSFHEMYITKADYEEWGSAIVNRKCP